MARRVAGAALAVILLGAGGLLIPYLAQKREATALTPAVPPLPPGSLIPAAIDPGHQLCIHDLQFAPDGQVARVLTNTGAKPGPPFEVTATAPGYQARTPVHPGWHEGALEIPITPPRRSVQGMLCFRNTGTSQFALMASGVGQKLARPVAYLDQQPLGQDIPLVFHRAKRASTFNRAGALVGHAAAFSPLPAWLIWLLIACVLVVLPVAVARALGLAAAAPAVAGGRIPAGAPPVPGRAFARRLRVRERASPAVRKLGRVTPVGWLAALVVLTTAFLTIWGLRVTTFQPDETLYVALANWVPHALPHSLTDLSVYQRGTQRLEVFILSVMLDLFGSPTGFKLAHLLNSLAFASAAIPSYLVARGLGARRVTALIAALLTVAIPWTVLMTSFLTEPVAYPAFAWATWATWRAVSEPTPRRDLLALALIFVALLARSLFIVLLALLPLAAVIHEARFGSIRPRAFLRRHPVLTGAVAIGALALILSLAGVLPPLSRLTGQYGTKLSIDWAQLRHQVSFWASRAVVGNGFIGFALGGAWIVAQAIRPRDGRSHAFAIVALVGVLLLIYASKTPPGVPTYIDERYMIYLTPLLVVSCVLAFERADLRVVAVVGAGLFSAWLVWRQPWNPNGGPNEFFQAPAESFYARVGLLKLREYVPSWISLRDAAFLVAAAVTAVSAFAFARHPRAVRLRWIMLGALVLVQVAQAQYSPPKYVDTAGGRHQATYDQRAWIDVALRGKPGHVGALHTGIADTPDYVYLWELVQFWNRRVDHLYSFGKPAPPRQTPADATGELTADETSGDASATKPPLPQYLVLPRDFAEVAPVGQPVVRPLFSPFDLWRVDKPDRLLYRVYDAQQDGVIAEGDHPRIRFYAGAGEGNCTQIPLQGASAASRPTPSIPYRVGDKRGVLPPGQQVSVQIPLHFGGKPYVDLPIKVKGAVLTGEGRTYAARLHVVTVGRCTGG